MQPPKSQVILPGMNATFSCITTADGTSQWTVNGVICMPTPYNKECQSRGIIATIDENLDSAMTVLTLKMDGLAINNGSQIQCYSAYVTVDISAPASLVIAGERGGRGRGRTLL